MNGEVHINTYVHVAVGVIRDRHGKVLLAKRRDDVHQGGLWEFPGGKVEANESVQTALRRELGEELGIDIANSLPLIQVRHHYFDKSVLLDVWEVDGYHGSPAGKEGQPLQWVPADQLQPGVDCLYPLPAANAAIIKALRLPDTQLITGEFINSVDFLARVEQALGKGIRLMQFRPSKDIAALPDEKQRELLESMTALCEQYSAKLVLNASAGIPADNTHGLHYPARQLMTLRARPTIAPGRLFGASCHNKEELQRAAELDFDYAVLSPVSTTRSHPDTSTLGWELFQSLVQSVNIPIYALGGMSQTDIPQARAMGGQGIAAITSLWNESMNK